MQTTRLLNEKKHRKIIILLVILVVTSILILGVIVSIRHPYYRLVINGDSRKDFSQQYREFYDNANFPLRSNLIISIIENTPEERKQMEERLMKKTNKECPAWENCPLRIIAKYLEKKDILDPSLFFDINEDEALKLRIIELYTSFREAIMASGWDFSVGDSGRTLMMIARYEELLDTEEEEVWFKRIIEFISSTPKFYFTIWPHSINSSLLTLRFALDIENIDELGNTAEKLKLNPSEIEKARDIICSDAGTLSLPSAKSSFLKNLTNKGKLEDIGEVWSIVARKDFCQIERTSREQEIIDEVTAKNYLKPIDFGGISDVNYRGEIIKYLLVNSEKIFSK